MTWCKSAHLIFQMKNKRLLLSSSISTTAAHFVVQTVDLHTIVQQPDAFLK